MAEARERDCIQLSKDKGQILGTLTALQSQPQGIT